MESGVFDAARRDLATSHSTGTTLCEPFVRVFPVSGASVSLLVTDGSSTVCASDDIAARIDELQFDLGEGPCWDALASREPVLRPSTTDARVEWPAFGEALANDGGTAAVASVFAFPLAIGSLDIGAIDLYSVTPAVLDDGQVEGAGSMATIASWQVLRRVLGDSDGHDAAPAHSRREVHQATGMVLAQLGVTAEEAGLLLRAHAFATGRPVRELAADVVARRIDFSDDGRNPGVAS